MKVLGQKLKSLTDIKWPVAYLNHIFSAYWARVYLQKYCILFILEMGQMSCRRGVENGSRARRRGSVLSSPVQTKDMAYGVRTWIRIRHGLRQLPERAELNWKVVLEAF